LKLKWCDIFIGDKLLSGIGLRKLEKLIHFEEINHLYRIIKVIQNIEHCREKKKHEEK